jgi:hypothetical protein
MLAAGRIESVMGSIQKYLNDNYTLTPIQFLGQAFDQSLVQEWVRADLMIGEGPFYRQVGVGASGKDLLMVYNLNIFAKIEFIRSGNAFRILRIRDTLRQLFTETTHIPVKDHAGGNPNVTVGVARCFDCSEQDMGEQTGIGCFQYNLGVGIRYEEKWETPS